MNTEIVIGTKLQGRYNLIVRDAETLEAKRETGWFDNLILNAGLDRIAAGTYILAAQVGTSNVAPAVTQTALSAYLAGTTTTTSSSNSTQATAPYFGKMVRVFRFAAGTATGTLAEVGVGWTAAAGSLFSRALITDFEGNPTTITVLSDEVLDVVYELRLYPDTIDKVFEAVISSVTYDCVLRASSVTSSEWSGGIGSMFGGIGAGTGIVYNGSLGPITSAPSGSASSSDGAVVLGSYTTGTYFRTVQTSWGLGAGNLVGGVTAIVMKSTLGSFKMSVTPAIPKDNTNTLTITFKFTWARFTP